MEVLESHASQSFGPPDMNLSTERSKGGCCVRGMYDVATLPSKDTVERVFAGHCKALLSPFAKTVEVPTVIPASGFLAEVPTQGSLVAELGAGHF